MATVKALVVAGGGGGGKNGGGGGGAGGYLYEATHTVTPQAYTVTVGAGGLAGNGSVYGSQCDGGNSVFDNMTATGGGGAYGDGVKVASDGGSGAGDSWGPTRVGQGTGGQGNNGGNSATNNAGGGGGQSAVGGDAVAGTSSGNGGAGVNNSITGASVGYAGGGGGGFYPDTATGGTATHGGGAGKNTNGVAGTPNTGGGGGGEGNGTTEAGAGGSGVVIISYVTSTFVGLDWVATGGTKTTDGLNTVHRFTESGTFTITAFPTNWTGKRKLTIDHTKVPNTNQTNFPVLVADGNFNSDIYTQAALRREINANAFLSHASLTNYWRLENTTATVGGLTLTNNNTVAFNAAKFSNGADFGTSGTTKYLSHASNIGWGGGACSVSFVFKCTSEPASGELQYLTQFGDATSHNTIQIIYKNNGGTKQLVLERVREFVANDTITYNVTLGTTVFHFIILTYDGTTIHGYVDGVDIGSVTSSGNGSSGGSSNFIISANGAQVHGIIDDFAVFNSALTPAEVRSIVFGTSDLRFSSDSAGTTELASEVVFFDPDNSLGEIHVNVPSVTTATDTVFYVWYNNSAAAPYAATDTYGSQAVWVDKARYHFQDLTADSTVGAHTLTAVSDPASTTGKITSGVDLDSTDYYTIVNHADFRPAGAFSVGAWVKTSATGTYGTIIQSRNVVASATTYGWALRRSNTDKFNLSVFNPGGTEIITLQSSSSINDNAWHRVIATWSGTVYAIYIDGSSVGTTSSSTAPAYHATNYVDIGVAKNESFADDQFWTGQLDEVFVINGTGISADWITTEYNNQNSPSTFITESSAAPLSSKNILLNQAVNRASTY